PVPNGAKAHAILRRPGVTGAGVSTGFLGVARAALRLLRQRRKTAVTSLRAPRVVSAIAFLGALAASSTAAAQDRLHLEQLGDEVLSDQTVVKRDYNEPDVPYARFGALGGTSATFVPGGPGFVSPFAGLNVGLHEDNTSYLALASQATFPTGTPG